MHTIDKLRVLHHGLSLWGTVVRSFDQGIIFLALDRLYQWQAAWLNLPQLEGYSDQGVPCYPEQKEGRH